MKNLVLLFTDPNRNGGATLLVLLFVATMFATLIDARAGEQVDEVERVSAAISHIIYEGIPERHIKPFPGNPIATDVSGRHELSTAIVEASRRHGVPEMILVAISYRENSFGNEKMGALGERSAFQIIPSIAKAIRKGLFPWSTLSEPECNLRTVRGAALCAAALLRIHKQRCRTSLGAIVLYASGRTCRPDNRKLRWIVRDRIGIQKYLENKFGRVGQ